MKKITTMVCASAIFCGLAFGVQAHEGTVYVTGVINDNTCVVSPDSIYFTLEMGNIASKQFYRAGDGTRYEPFTINLEDCGGEASGVTVSFHGRADSLNQDLLALNGGDGYATGMGIGIYNADKSMIPLGKESEQTVLSPDQIAVKLNFYARYIADGAKVTTGTANASAVFMLTYA